MWPAEFFSAAREIIFSKSKNLQSNLKDGKATSVARALSNHNLPTDRTRELFKPPKETESFLGLIF